MGVHGPEPRVDLTRRVVQMDISLDEIPPEHAAATRALQSELLEICVCGRVLNRRARLCACNFACAIVVTCGSRVRVRPERMLCQLNTERKCSRRRRAKVGPSGAGVPPWPSFARRRRKTQLVLAAFGSRTPSDPEPVG
eukprot:3331721-Prymnesium_polylepis.1